MEEDVAELLECWEKTRKGWNFNADEYNQWENLSLEEKVELLLSTVKDL